MAATICLTDGTIVLGSPVVLTASADRSDAYSDVCFAAKYICGVAVANLPSRRTSPTTPITSKAGDVVCRRTTRPIGDSPGKNRSAKVRLITTTPGLDGVS